MAAIQRVCIKHGASILSITRSIHSRHFPNEKVTVGYPKANEFEKIKDTKAEDWPFYGGRVKVERTKKGNFPQVLPIMDESPKDIRQKQIDSTMRFGSNPRTYPTMLVYPDGSTVTIPYHKPVGTLYLPGADTQISLGVKTKAKVMRRVKVGL